jgi:hypothetical protein
MRVAASQDADSSETHEAAGQELTAQVVNDDARAAVAEMLKDAQAQEMAKPEANTQSLDELEQQAEEQTRGSFLNELREQETALAPLDDAALERVLDCAGDIQKMRGQLVEEFGNLELERIAKEMGPDYTFYRGDQIRDQNNRQLTDGMIVREAEDGGFDVVGIVEAKAGRASRRELSASRESFDNLSQADRLELQRAAIDEFRNENGLDDPGDAGWKSAQDILNDHSAEIEERMRAMHGADIGQLSRDFERLMPNAGDDSVTLTLGKKDDAEIRVSRAQTEAYVVTPSDVSTERTLENFKAKEPNIETNSVSIAATAGEITALAETMQRAAQSQIAAEQPLTVQTAAIEAAEQAERVRIRSLEQAEEAFEHA